MSIKRMNRSRLTFAKFVANDEFKPTFGPVILGVRQTITSHPREIQSAVLAVRVAPTFVATPDE